MDTVGKRLQAAAKRLRRQRPKPRPEGPLNADCPCGAGYSELGGVLYVTPHAMNCPVLKRLVAREKAGWCASCRARIKVQRNRRVTKRWCPKGCFHQVSIR